MNGTERNMTIYKMCDNGASFADIARKFGISTERARQIYVAHKAMEERDDTPMYKALCEAAEDAGRPYPERAASRAYHYLTCSGITELAQLADYSDSQLLKIRCFGIGSLEIARAAQAKAMDIEDAQMNELKPCPFCCGGLEIVSDPVDEWGLVTHEPGCFFLADGLLIKTQFIHVDSIPAWNTRAERTCHIVKASRKYVLSDGTELFEDGCSKCNGYLDDGDNYCPNCGRRVER